MIDLALVLIFLLGLIAVIDAKFRSIPSAFITIILFMTLAVHFYDFNVGLISLSFGIFASLFAVFLFELDFIGGLADIKYMAIIGAMIPNVQMFFSFLLITVLFGMAYKGVYVLVLKRPESDYVPFLPCLYAVYLTLFFIGGV